MSDSALYSGLSGATAAWRQLDVVSNNVANVSTQGYKAGRISFRTEVEGQFLQAQAAVATISPVMSDGPLEDTGNAGHLALRGEGWLTVQTEDGSHQLTRDGRFALDNTGLLRAPDGAILVGEQGPIQLAAGEGFRVDPQGRVFGEVSGEAGLIRMRKGPTKHAGGNRWLANGKMERAEPTIVQGALEGSNVDAAMAMTELIEASRYFEAFQKAIAASDEMTGRLNQSGGK